MRKAIVMAGGQGSRLWPLTAARPKPLVRVADRPVMAHILTWLRRHGITEVLATLHYRAEEIRRAFGDGRSFDLELAYRVEEEPLGTAGSVKYAEDWVAGEPFLIVSGDALTDLDLTALWRRHRETRAWLTLGLKPVEDPSEYGVVELDSRGRVTRFQEKPEPGHAISHLANTGIYCVAPRVLRELPRGRACDWSRDIFPRLLAKDRPLFGYTPEGYWRDIGSMECYRRGQRDVLEDAVRVTLPEGAGSLGVRMGPDVRIVPGAVIEGPTLLGAGCRIERGAWVLPGSVIGEGTIVHAGACLRGAVVGARCEIGLGAIVHECVLDDDVSVGAACRVSEGAVIGRGCCLLEGACVRGGRRVEPDQVVSAPLALAGAVSVTREELPRSAGATAGWAAPKADTADPGDRVLSLSR